jgi:beta-alanine--pyruvate transaminase
MTSATQAIATPNDLEAFWMPFTPNRAFKQKPRIIARAEGMFYYTT